MVSSLFKTKVSKYRYDIGIKGQGQICLKSTLQLTTQIPLSFFMEGVQIAYVTLESSQVNVTILKTCLQLIMWNFVSFDTIIAYVV